MKMLVSLAIVGALALGLAGCSTAQQTAVDNRMITATQNLVALNAALIQIDNTLVGDAIAQAKLLAPYQCGAYALASAILSTRPPRPKSTRYRVERRSVRLDRRGVDICSTLGYPTTVTAAPASSATPAAASRRMPAPIVGFVIAFLTGAALPIATAEATLGSAAQAIDRRRPEGGDGLRQAAGDLRRDRPCARSAFRRRRCGEGEKPLAAHTRRRRRPPGARRRHRLQGRESAKHAGRQTEGGRRRARRHRAGGQPDPADKAPRAEPPNRRAALRRRSKRNGARR